MGIFASIASAVAPSLISGLFGGGDRKTTTESSVNFVKLRRNAEKAGFNPLTALKHGAGGFTSTTSTVPGLSTREVLGEALGAGLETWFNRDEIAEQEELERIRLETMRAERDNIRARTAFLGAQTAFGSSIPTYESTGVETQETAPLDPAVPEPGRRTSSDPRDAGRGDTFLNPRVVDAETTEARYGDIGQEFAGARNLWMDNTYNAAMQRLVNRFGEDAAAQVDQRVRTETETPVNQIIREERQRLEEELHGAAPLSYPTSRNRRWQRGR